MCPSAVIDLSAIAENYCTVSDFVGNNVTVAAVVKDEAYGLGANEVSKAVYKIGCRSFWVAYPEEAYSLRQILPLDAEIYFLQGFVSSDVEMIKNYKIVPTINSINEFQKIKGKNIDFVLHVDTGMARLGLREEEVDAVSASLGNEKISYVISHLAHGNGSDFDFRQAGIFNRTLSKIRRIVPNVKGSISASGGAFLGKGFAYDLVRVGAFLYGIKTGDMLSKNVLSIKAEVLQTFWIDENTSVGYNSSFVSTKEMRVAVVSIGYGDGIRRSLSNNGVVQFRDISGKFYRAPIIGAISMDVLMCDVTDIPENMAQPLSDCIILDANYSINDMAKNAGTIPYEILVGMNLMNKRRFRVSYAGFHQ